MLIADLCQNQLLPLAAGVLLFFVAGIFDQGPFPKLARKQKNILWSAILTLLCLASFPVNPLVLTGIVKVKTYPLLFAIGWVTWACGMVLVMAPIVMFPRHGGVPKGKSFVATTRLVDRGLYAIVRHPQYTGGILSIFFTTFLWYPHWVFGVLGVIGTIVIYISCRLEDQYLIEKFGDDYRAYMHRVPGMNFILGIFRLLRGTFLPIK
jgi:protein-S-isoprenylcysteine O-methyltransferase Ste14